MILQHAYQAHLEQAVADEALSGELTGWFERQEE